MQITRATKMISLEGNHNCTLRIPNMNSQRQLSHANPMPTQHNCFVLA